MEEKILVNKEALIKLMNAINGPAYFIRELQVTRSPLIEDNPIDVIQEDINNSFSNSKENILPIKDITKEVWNSFSVEEKNKYMNNCMENMNNISDFIVKFHDEPTTVVFGISQESIDGRAFYSRGNVHVALSILQRLNHWILKSIDKEKVTG